MQTINTFWLSCLEYFKNELNAQQFNTWINPLQLDSSHTDNSSPILIAPNKFVLQWVKDNFLLHINKMAKIHFSHEIQFQLKLADQENQVKEIKPVSKQKPKKIKNTSKNKRQFINSIKFAIFI